MNRQNRISLFGQGCLTGAVLMLLLGAAEPLAQPLGQLPRPAVERIEPTGAQPIRMARTLGEPAVRSAPPRSAGVASRWVF